jgi:plastocyanin
MLRSLKIVLFGFFCLTLGLLGTGTAQASPLAAIVHTGTLSANETWNAVDNPHFIDGSVIVPAGVTLTLQPGVIVRFTSSSGRLQINGTLNAIGTAAHNIIFTSSADSAPAQWDALVVSGGTAHLAYADIRYGGSGYSCAHSYFSPVCVQDAGTLTLDHMRFYYNSPLDPTTLSGVVTAYSANDADTINLSITNSTFGENGKSNQAASYYAVRLDGPGVRLDMSGNTFSNNQLNRVLLQNNPLKTQASAVLSQQPGLEAYEFYPPYLGQHVIPSGNTLTIEPGVKLLSVPGAWASGYAIVVEGTLIANGTDANPIIMDASDPAYGWGGLIVQGAGASATLSHVEILHGGRAGGANQRYVNLAALDGALLSLSSSRVADNVVGASNYQFGMVYVSNASATLVDNTLENNQPGGVNFYPMYVTGANSTLEMTNNTFSGNSIRAVLLGADGLAGTRNTLRPQPGLAGYDLGVPYAVDTYTLLPGGELSLEPGVIIRGVSGTYGRGIVFKVQGRLNATGAPDQPVVFRAVDDSAQTGWAGIYVNGGEANLAAITIRNAGRGQEYPYPGPYPSLWVDGGGRLSLNYATISGNRNANQPDTTIKVENASASIRNSVFSGNGNPDESDFPLAISGAASRVTLAGNTFDTNGARRILLSGSAMTGADFSLPAVAGLEGYELASKFTVPVGVTMTVQPGVRIMGRAGTGLVVNGGLVAEAQPGKEIMFTSTANSAADQWAGVIFSGAGAHGVLDGVSLRCGGGSMAPYSDPLGSLIFNNLAANAVQVRHSQISTSGTAGWQIVNSNVSQNTILDGNRISSNPGIGLRISGTSQVVLANTAALNNTGGGIFLAQSGVQAALLHTTLAGNSYGVRTVNGSSAVLTNSILSRNAVGAWADTGSTLTLNSSLWDANTTATTGAGTITNTTPYSGSAGFDPADGYHLTLYSQALGKGQSTTVAADIDGSSRPQPVGSAPDLGADEFNQGTATEMTAVKLALPPIWMNLPDPVGNPYGELLQKYWIRFLYGSNDVSALPLSVSVQDVLPAGLTYASEAHSPEMSFSHSGQTLQWTSDQNVAPQQTVDIQVDASSANPTPGSTYTNNATVNAGGSIFNLSVQTQVAVFAPLITWPASGEICPSEDTSLVIEGSAQPGTTIEVYEGSIFMGQALTDSHGLFSVSYTGSSAGSVDLILSARACKNGTCSELTSVELFPSLSFWCPQRSAWKGTPGGGPMAGKDLVFGFRDQDGYVSTQEWYIEGVLGFANTQLDIHACSCPPETGTTDRPTNLWVVADGVTYAAAAGSNYPDYHFNITGGAHSVEFWAECQYEEDEKIIKKKINDRGSILIDPDGYVFDSTLGFDPADPTAHVLPGSTVTLMANIPAWGGWVQWPAHLYNNQVNPQVVGNEGYYAFFTPPGEYYLQVTPPAGFQPWRSPVVTVVNEIVHVNVPLTPFSNGTVYTVQTSLSGFSNPNLVVTPGSVVKWVAVQGPWEEINALVAAGVNPVLQMISNPNPFASVTGWDSGRLVPGETFEYRFDVPGTYTYTDSAGHTATILVGSRVFLPIIKK